MGVRPSRHGRALHVTTGFWVTDPSGSRQILPHTQRTEALWQETGPAGSRREKTPSHQASLPGTASTSQKENAWGFQGVSRGLAFLTVWILYLPDGLGLMKCSFRVSWLCSPLLLTRHLNGTTAILLMTSGEPKICYSHTNSMTFLGRVYHGILFALNGHNYALNLDDVRKKISLPYI